MKEKEVDIKQFGQWRITRGGVRQDGSKTWVATKGSVAMVDETWQELKDRIQTRLA